MTRLAEQLYREAGIDDAAAEWRRNNTRRHVYEGLDIYMEGREKPFQGHTVDVALDSIGLTCRTRLATASQVRIHRALGSPHEFCEGIVVHCEPGIRGFRVGVKVLMQRRSTTGSITGASLTV